MSRESYHRGQNESLPRSHHEMVPKTVSLFHTLKVTRLNTGLSAGEARTDTLIARRRARLVESLPSADWT
jgi:hypothetical protein